MKLFLGAMLLCFFGGIVLRHRSATLRTTLLLVISALVCLGYYLLRQI